MPGSWTDRLLNVSISSLVKMNITGVPLYEVIDGSFADVPPGFLFKAVEKQALAYDNAALYQMCYMSAACDCYEDYVDATKMRTAKASHILGTVNFTVEDSVGRHVKYCIPLIFASSSRLKFPKQNVEHRPMTNGLFCGQALVVAVQDTPEETKKTFRHELVHLMVAALPELKEIMYGDNPQAQMEEIVTHIVTDKFSILKNVEALDIIQTCRTLPMDKDNKDTIFEVHEIEDFKGSDGKSIISKSVTLDAKADKKLFNQYLSQRKEYYSL